MFEALGSERYSSPALFGMDGKLAELMPEQGGTFVEAGAHNGYTQSNTYYLERYRGWSGVLIDAVPSLAAKCARRRRRSQVFCCALVGQEYALPDATMRVSDLMSEIEGDASLPESGHGPKHVTVQARTLSSVLDEAQIGPIDLIVLDVERRELDVLAGLDLERHSPRYLLIEELEPGTMRARYSEALHPTMRFVEALSPHDLLYERI
jgi:FkbM family methyltransferase